MKRVIIRNYQSKRNPKPRVLDAIINDDGEIYLETKVNRNQEMISLKEVMNQISLELNKK